MRWAKVPAVGAALKSNLSSGKSSAISISLRPMSFHCSSTASEGLGTGLGASFFASCERAGVTRIVAAKIATANVRTPFNIVAFIIDGFIGDSSCQAYGRMLQEFVREENIVAK